MLADQHVDDALAGEQRLQDHVAGRLGQHLADDGRSVRRRASASVGLTLLSIGPSRFDTASSAPLRSG